MSDIVFNESFEDGVASTKAQGAIIYAATFNPVLELDDNEVIRSAADIALRLGFVQAPPAK